MPNHWESSARPLFVKTVFVNGNRHAILSQKDPLLQSFSKKQSRPNSSSSFASIFSNSTIGSEDSKSKLDVRQRNGKDISSQLQNCLIKFRLPSNGQESIKNSKDEVDFLEEQEEVKEHRSKKYGSKRKKSNNGKPTKKKNCRHFYEEYTNENKLSGSKNKSNNCCYVYNFENNKGKKNYCFMKITSKPSHLILNCSCDKRLGKLYNFCGSKDSTSDKNNILISATFHNLIMTADKNEKLSQNPSDYFISQANPNSCEMYLNNGMISSKYNSLSERVIQWLDLANKRKRRDEIPEKPLEEIAINNIERIFAGKTFVDENSKARYFVKSVSKMENKAFVKKEKINQKEAPSDDVNTEVKAEENIETALSIEKKYEDQLGVINFSINPRLDSFSYQKAIQLYPDQEKTQDDQNSTMKIPTKIESGASLSDYLKTTIAKRLNTTVLDSTKTTLNVQDLFPSDSGECSNCFLNGPTQRKILKEKRKPLVRQSKFNGDEGESKEDDFKIIALKCWEKDSPKNTNIFESSNEAVTVCCCEKNNEESTQRVKSRVLLQEFETIQRPINNLNIVRSRSSSHLQQNKISWLSEGKNAWPSEKDMGRPQLHIFIPCIPSKESSEESISECESFLEGVCL